MLQVVCAQENPVELERNMSWTNSMHLKCIQWIARIPSGCVHKTGKTVPVYY